MSNKLRHNHAFKAALLMTTGFALIACSSNPDSLSNTGQSGQSELVTPATSTDKSQKQNMEWVRLLRVAERAWRLNDHDTALRLYRNANQARPADLRPLMGMAEILRKTNRGRMAINIYSAALKSHPDNAEIHSGIGYSLLGLDKPFIAMKSFQKAIDLEADNAKALGGMAVALDTAGEHERAHNYYREAIRQDPDNLTYQSNLGLSLALSGHTDEAIALLERVADSPKATAKHRQNLALVYGLAGKSQEAMRYSRMDLSERDSRNNQLYFQALNGDGTGQDYAKAAKPDSEKPAPSVIGEMPAVSDRFAAPQKPIVDRTPIAPNSSPENQNILSTGTKKPVRLAAVEETKTLRANPPMTDQTAAPRKLTPAAPHQSQPARELPASSETVVADRETDSRRNMAKSPAVIQAENQAITSLAVREEFLSATYMPEPVIAAEKPVAPQVANIPALPQVEKTAEPKIVHAALPQSPAPMQSLNQGPVGNFGPQTAAVDKAYFVQLGAYRSARQAMQGWQILKAKHQYLLTDYNPLIATANLGEDNGGLYYRLRIGGFVQKATPLSICSDLRNQQTDCFMPYVTGFSGPILDMSATAASPARPGPVLREAKLAKTVSTGGLASSPKKFLSSDEFIAYYGVQPNSF